MAEDQKAEKIGDFLIKTSAISIEQVQEILAIQEKDPDKLFGMIAMELGYIDDETIKAYIDLKRKKPT